MWPILLTVLLAILGITGDYFLKLAGRQPNALLSANFVIGLVIYGLTAVGWMLLMQRMRLGVMGGVYSIAMVLLCVILGYIFGERLVVREWIGIGLAVVSLLLLTRFS